MNDLSLPTHSKITWIVECPYKLTKVNKLLSKSELVFLYFIDIRANILNIQLPLMLACFSLTQFMFLLPRVPFQSVFRPLLPQRRVHSCPLTTGTVWIHVLMYILNLSNNSKFIDYRISLIFANYPFALIHVCKHMRTHTQTHTHKGFSGFLLCWK